MRRDCECNNLNMRTIGQEIPQTVFQMDLGAFTQDIALWFCLCSVRIIN